MKVRCERDGTVFVANIRSYPFEAKVPTDKVIDCPVCKRRYFLEQNGKFEADRTLTVLK